ncbi:MAG TPA: VCBS repeat-containing protein, partial [Acidobacteria bacterium]|nr:VCBS repeat-containing protein [Acidobacteriota bacterium]
MAGLVGNAAASEGAAGGIECPVPYQYMIPGSAHVSGLGGTSWVSDLVLYNLGDEDAGIEAYFLEKDTDNSNVAGESFFIQAGSSMMLDDVLSGLFRKSGTSGAIFICASQPLMVSSRTYNNAASGTFGQHIGGVPVLHGIVPEDTAYIFQLTRNDDFRTNIGFANALPSQLDVEVTLYDAQGTELKKVPVTVPPYGFLQKTDILGSDVADAYAKLRATSDEARYFAYASIIDNHTGDPTFVTPQIQYSREDTVLYLPAAAHVDGYGGTHWRTDVELLNLGWSAETVTVELLARDQDNTTPPSQEYDLEPSTGLRLSDVLYTAFGFSGTAALRVTCTSGYVAVSSRTYNQTATGTYGQFVPAVPVSAVVTPGETVNLAQLATSSSPSTGFRTNIGMLNTSAVPIAVVVELLDEDGTRLGERSVSLEPSEFTQVDKVFQGLSGASGNNLTARLHTDSAGGSFVAYASVVDNRSGDPVFVPAQRREPMVPITTRRGDTGDSATFLAPLDVDGDGDEDLVVALRSGGIHARIMEGGHPVDLEPVAASGSYDCLGGMVDATGVHLAAGNAQGVDLFTRSQGTWSQPVHVDVAHAVKRVRFADMDRDGDLDLVVGLKGSFAGGSKLALAELRNDGSSYDLVLLQENFVNGQVPAEYVGDLVVPDLNGDSYPDPIMSGQGMTYIMWEMLSDGVGGLTGSKRTNTAYVALCTGDFDVDGAADLAGTGSSHIDLFPEAATG